jgi:branched-chain amino acid transport system substrate-binding protein
MSNTTRKENKMIRLIASTGAIFALITVGPALAEPGVTADTITIGQSAGLTGGQAIHSKQVQLGINAYFSAVNKAGGVNGRQLKLLSVDDQGKKDNVAASIKKFADEGKVFALTGFTSGAGVEAGLPVINAARIPMLSPNTGNMGIRAQFSRYIFHTRAGYGDEMKKVVSYLTLTGTKRFAIAYLGDTGVANPMSMIESLAASNLKPVADVPLDRNASDFTQQIDALMKGQPDAVLMISNAKPVAEIVRGMKKRGYGGYFVTSSFSGLSVIDQLKEDARGLIMIQVLPPVNRLSARIVKDYADDLKAFDPNAKPDYESLESYIGTRVMVEGIKRAGTNLTRERFVEAMESIKALDLGGYEITFTNKNHNGARYVDTGVVGTGGAIRF